MADRHRRERLHSLDVLRGLAALTVVFWHWQHFFYVGGSLGDFHRERQPLYGVFASLYQHGGLAVSLFFAISGFVFFHLFSQDISRGALSLRSFAVDRFSRLYPLHFATFALVALLQFLYWKSEGGFFVYPDNDLYHAMLNVLLVPAWGFEKGWSFNAPVWSVSVEVLLYAMFFALCLAGRARVLLVPCMIVLGYFVYPYNFKLGPGILVFFCGAAACLVSQHAERFLGRHAPLAWSAVASGAACLAVWLVPGPGTLVLTGVLFPSLVAMLAAVNVMFPGFLKPLSAIGDISYSSYLLHFPLQIMFVLVVDRSGLGRDVFYDPATLVAFMAVLIMLSHASHRFFEYPIQQAIRKALQGKPSAAATPAAGSSS